MSSEKFQPLEHDLVFIHFHIPSIAALSVPCYNHPALRDSAILGDQPKRLQERRSPVLSPTAWLTRLRRWRADFAALGFIWLLVLVFFSPLLNPLNRHYMVQGDFTNQFYPFRHFAASEWAAGRIPLWNPYMFGGHPFAADIQTAVFYPPAFLTAVVLGRDGLPFLALEIEMIGHYLLAGLFTYLFARRLIGAVLPACIAAIVFTFGGYLTSYPAQQLAMLETSIWLPLILLFVLLATDREPSTLQRRLGGHVLAGFTFGIAILAGHPQTNLFIGYTVLAFTLYRSLVVRHRWRAIPVNLVVFGIAAIGLAAIQIGPTLEFLGLSTRTDMPFERAGHGYQLSSLLGILLPGWRDERALYVGVAPLVLAAVALVARPRLGAFWAGLALFGAVLSVGANTVLFRLLYDYVPGFQLFQDQERAIYLFSFAAAILAGYGTAWLFRTGRFAQSSSDSSVDLSPRSDVASDRVFRWIWRGLEVALLMTIILTPVIWIGYQSYADLVDNPYRSMLASAIRFAVVLAIVSVWFWLARRLGLNARSWIGRILAASLILLIVVDLFTISWGRNFTDRNPLRIDEMSKTAAFIQDFPELYRVRVADAETVVPSNYGEILGMPAYDGDSPFVLQRIEDFLLSGAEWRLWQLWNVKFYVTSEPVKPSEKPGVELAFEDQGILTYRMILSYSLPRVWAVRNVNVVDSAGAAYQSTLAEANQPGDVVTLEQEPAVGPIQPGNRPEVHLEDYSAQRMEFRAIADGPAMLVVSEAYYPGWKAYRDGVQVPIYQADYVLRALDLPAGEHHFVLVYDPLPFKIGLAITAATVLLGGIATVLMARRQLRGG